MEESTIIPTQPKPNYKKTLAKKEVPKQITSSTFEWIKSGILIFLGLYIAWFIIKKYTLGG